MKIAEQLKLLANHPEVIRRRNRFIENARNAKSTGKPIWTDDHGWLITDKVKRDKQGKLICWDRSMITEDSWTSPVEKYEFLAEMQH